MNECRKAPELQVSEWLNTTSALSLSDFLGRVIVIEAFQMLCPGCVSHGLPQAARIRETFAEADVAVLGLHTVFEHHEAQGTAAALKAFLHEYRIGFPVGIDAQVGGSSLPVTMSQYQLRGTPSLLLIDKAGHYRRQFFGATPDLALGAAVMELVLESDQSTTHSVHHTDNVLPGCSPQGCAVGDVG